MSITLSYGATSIPLDDPDFPYTYSWNAKQTLLETEQGQRYVFDFGVKRRRWTLKWNYLPVSQFVNLEEFILAVNFQETPFTFTDHRGYSYTVRCMSFSHAQVTPYHYSVTLVLEEEV